MSFEEVTRRNAEIVLAAVNAAGVMDQGWRKRVTDNALAIKDAAEPRSWVMRLLNELDGFDADGQSLQVKHFTGVVLGFDKEESSKRIVVALGTFGDGPNGSLNDTKEHPIRKITVPGVEYVRTERTDSDAGQEMEEQLQGLQGMKCMFTVKVESAGLKKVRVLIRIRPLSQASDDVQAMQAMQAARQLGYIA